MSSWTNGVSTLQTKKYLRIENWNYFTVSATQDTFLLFMDCLNVIINLSLLTTDTMLQIIEFLKASKPQHNQVGCFTGKAQSQ
jgi:hypothetical protein